MFSFCFDFWISHNDSVKYSTVLSWSSLCVLIGSKESSVVIRDFNCPVCMDTAVRWLRSRCLFVFVCSFQPQWSVFGSLGSAASSPPLCWYFFLPEERESSARLIRAELEILRALMSDCTLNSRLVELKQHYVTFAEQQRPLQPRVVINSG